MVVNYQCFNTPIYSAIVYFLKISFYIFLQLYIHMVLSCRWLCCRVCGSSIWILCSVKHSAASSLLLKVLRTNSIEITNINTWFCIYIVQEFSVTMFICTPSFTPHLQILGIKWDLKLSWCLFIWFYIVQLKIKIETRKEIKL